MVAKKVSCLLHFTHLSRAIVALCLAFFSLPAAAVLVFNANSEEMTSIVFITPPLRSIVLSNTFPTGTSNPTLARNLQRAHAWSSDDATPTLLWQTTPRMTSLQSNMARAKAFRLQ